MGDRPTCRAACDGPAMRTALVTGASRGIGLAIATSLARSGFGLTVSSRSEEDLIPLAAALHGQSAPWWATTPPT